MALTEVVVREILDSFLIVQQWGTNHSMPRSSYQVCVAIRT